MFLLQFGECHDKLTVASKDVLWVLPHFGDQGLLWQTDRAITDEPYCLVSYAMNEGGPQIHKGKKSLE